MTPHDHTTTAPPAGFADLMRRAREAALSGDTDAILDDLDDALRHTTEASERAQLHLAAATVTQGSADRSLSATAAERAVSVLRRSDDHVHHGIAAAIASTCVARTGRREEALALVVESLAAAELADGTAFDRARRSNAIATTLYEMGAFAEASARVLEAFAGAHDAGRHAREILATSVAWLHVEWARWQDGPVDVPALTADLDEALTLLEDDEASPVSREVIGPVLRAELAVLAGAATSIERSWTSSPVVVDMPDRLGGWVDLVEAELDLVEGRPDDCLARLDASGDRLVHAVDDHRAARARLLRLQALVALGRTEEAASLATELAMASRRDTLEARADLAGQLSVRVEVERAARKLRDTSGALAEAIAVDPLTRVGSRYRYEELRAEAVSREGIGTVFLIDLDGFKAVNDDDGHVVGDRVLAAVGSLLLRCFSPYDEIARLGGDEFVVVLDVEDEQILSTIRTRLMEMFRSERWSTLGASHRVTASVGVARGPLTELDRLIGEADAAMYRAKRAGGDGLVTA